MTMTIDNLHKDEDKAFFTQCRGVTPRLHNLVLESGNVFYSLSSEHELTNIWNLYHREEDEMI